MNIKPPFDWLYELDLQESDFSFSLDNNEELFFDNLDDDAVNHIGMAS